MLTKKTPTPVEASWQDALARFDDWQRARGHGGEDPARLRGRPRAARRVGRRAATSSRATSATGSCATSRASCPSAARSKSTVARKLAAIRTFYRQLVERGELEANPAELVSSPKKDAYLPKVLKPDEVAELLERIPGSTPLDLRDRALLELAYAAGLRAEELVNLDVESLDPDAEEVRVEGKGGRTRVVPVGRARLACDRPLPGARQAGARTPATEPGAVHLEDRQAAVHLGRAGGGSGSRRRAGPGVSAAYAAPLVRHAPAGGRRRPAHDPGAAGTLHRSARPRHTLG